VNGGGDPSSNGQTAIMTPYFVDRYVFRIISQLYSFLRLLDQCRILDPHSMFIIGVLIASHVANVICVKDAPEEKNLDSNECEKSEDVSSEKQQQPSAVAEHDEQQESGTEDQPMQQIDEGLRQEGNEEQITPQNSELIHGEDEQNNELASPEQEAGQIEPPQQATGTTDENAGVPEGVGQFKNFQIE